MTKSFPFAIALGLLLLPAATLAQESTAIQLAEPSRAAACVAGDPMPVVSAIEGAAALPAPVPSGVPPVPIPNVCELQGSAGTVRIRGSNSTAARPLYVIDGVVTQVPDGAADPLKGMDSRDIESITVLKDRAGVARYGAEARDGVVIVQTRTRRAPAPQP